MPDGILRVPESQEIITGLVLADKLKKDLTTWVTNDSALTDEERELVIRFTEIKRLGMSKQPLECRQILLREARYKGDLLRSVTRIASGNISLTI